MQYTTAISVVAGRFLSINNYHKHSMNRINKDTACGLAIIYHHMDKLFQIFQTFTVKCLLNSVDKKTKGLNLQAKYTRKINYLNQPIYRTYMGIYLLHSSKH